MNLATETLSISNTETQTSSNANKLWLEWQVSSSDDDEAIISFDYSLVEKDLKEIKAHKVSIPIQAIYHLLEKFNWLQLLRNPEHRPLDPYELVQFKIP